MTKVLFLLSIFVMLATAGISYLNKKTIAEFRAERGKTNLDIKSALKEIGNAQREVAVVDNQLKEVTADVEQAAERANQMKITLKNAANSCERYNSDIAEKESRKKDLQSQLEGAFKSLPGGVTIDTMTEHINQVKTTIANNAKQVEDATAATKAKQDEVKKVQDQVEEVAKRIEDRKKLYDRNALSARVVAVNNGWGFVVIDADENKKITPDTKLLITRGQQTVGKLDIVTVEGNKTIANIVQKSLQNGVRIAPGDHVILESLVQ